MLLYHVSPRKNRVSIAKRGIDPAKAQSIWKRSWLVPAEKIGLAIEHVRKRHRCRLFDVWEVDSFAADAQPFMDTWVFTSDKLTVATLVENGPET